jgi:hypothetical protein
MDENKYFDEAKILKVFPDVSFKLRLEIFYCKIKQEEKVMRRNWVNFIWLKVLLCNKSPKCSLEKLLIHKPR